MSATPAYRKVYTELKEKIKDKTYPPGSLLPTEIELEDYYSVSRTTIRRAIGLLAADGYLQARQGRGTEILDVSTTQKLNHISSTTETLSEKGYKVTTQGMFIERIEAPAHVIEALDLSEGSFVYKIQRVQCADGAPIAIMVNYLKENVVPGIDQYTNKFTSLYSFIEKQYNVIFRDATEYISAIAADFNESQILKVAVGSPLLRSKRISRNEHGPFEYSVIKLLADKYEFSVYLQGR